MTQKTTAPTRKENLHVVQDRTLRSTCDQCRHWHRGYRLHGLKVPAFCNRHFHSQAGDDPACKDFGKIDTRSIEHPPYAHPGDMA